MKKIIFLILFAFTSSIFSSEYPNHSTKKILFNNIEHKMLIKTPSKYQRFELFKENKLIGYLSSEQKKDNTYNIVALYIDKDFRKNGYGKLILKFACSHLIKHGAQRFTLTPVPSEKNIYGVEDYFDDDPKEAERRRELLKKFYTNFGFVEKSYYMELIVINNINTFT